jgi:CDP-paratose 2-epimerase
MPTVVVTGSGGLIGSEAVARFARAGYDVVGIENDMRARFFGPDASTARTTRRLVAEFPTEFRSAELDIRDADGVLRLFGRLASDLAVVIHTAAQPSHDWAARDPQTDLGVNANGTLNVLEATRRVKPAATFIFTSTNKVYGDTPNRLPLEDRGRRLELPEGHRYFEGIDTRCRSTAACTRSSGSRRRRPT